MPQGAERVAGPVRVALRASRKPVLAKGLGALVSSRDVGGVPEGLGLAPSPERRTLMTLKRADDAETARPEVSGDCEGLAGLSAVGSARRGITRSLTWLPSPTATLTTLNTLNTQKGQEQEQLQRP